jgi:archaellum biogenesis ATPase FlaH
MLNFKTRKEIQLWSKENIRTYLIDGLIAHNSLNFITGVSNVGKSTVLYYLAKCITDNNDWFNFKTDTGKVLIFDNEMGMYLFSEKMDKLNQTQMDDLYHVEDDFIDVKNPHERAGLYSSIENMVKNHNLKLVIIDSLSACCGNLDENSNTDMRMFMDFADKLSHICTTFVIHHKGKNTETEFRGASIIKDRSDNFFVMDKSGEIKISKNRSGRLKDQRICFDYSEDESFIELVSNNSNSLITKPKITLAQSIVDSLEDGMNQSELFAKMRSNGISFRNSKAIELIKSMPLIDTKKCPKTNASKYYKIE